MCYCDPHIKTPYCDSLKCQEQLKKTRVDKNNEENKCQKCSYYGLYKQIKSGIPFQYYGDIPCHRCKHLKKENDEFTPASKEIPEDVWGNLKDWQGKDWRNVEIPKLEIKGGINTCPQCNGTGHVARMGGTPLPCECSSPMFKEKNK